MDKIKAQKPTVEKYYFMTASEISIKYYSLLTNHSIHTIKGTEQNLIKILSTGSLKTLKP